MCKTLHLGDTGSKHGGSVGSDCKTHADTASNHTPGQFRASQRTPCTKSAQPCLLSQRRHCTATDSMAERSRPAPTLLCSEERKRSVFEKTLRDFLLEEICYRLEQPKPLLWGLTQRCRQPSSIVRITTALPTPLPTTTTQRMLV